MRSRYSAYVLGELDYIASTQRAEMDRESAEKWSSQSDWQGLEVVEAVDNVVEFCARYKDKKGQLIEHRERSKFEPKDGSWIYVDGSTPTLRSSAKTGRNDPCPCGSGKKYKKCCAG
jgi:SEC-C motif domain protein